MIKIITFLLLFVSFNSFAYSLLTANENKNVSIKATQFATNLNITDWKGKLNLLIQTKYIDNCGEGKYIPKQGFDSYCKHYYTYMMAKEKGYKENLSNKYSKILEKTYDIANSDNSDFNEFFLSYGYDKVAFNETNQFKDICDAQYKNRFLSNSCIVSLANKTQNPFNRYAAFCYYALSKVKTDNGISYRERDQNSANECFIQFQQEHDEFLIWDAYMGYKMGASLALYANKNKLFDFVLSF